MKLTKKQRNKIAKYGEMWTLHMCMIPKDGPTYVAYNDKYMRKDYFDHIEISTRKDGELVETIWSDNENSHESI